MLNTHMSVVGALTAVPDELAAALGVPQKYFAVRDHILTEVAGGSFIAVAMSERGAGSRLSVLTTAYRREDDGFRVVVHVPADAMVGGVEGIGLLAAREMPQWLVASYAAVYAGVARAALDAAAEYVRGRGVTGRDGDLAALPSVRARLGRADAAVAALEVVITECARRVDAEPGTPETKRWVWRAELLAGETVQAVAASVVEACGAAVTRRGHPLERLYRDARCGALQPATSDVCADWLGLAALGADPDLDAEVPRW